MIIGKVDRILNLQEVVDQKEATSRILVENKWISQTSKNIKSDLAPSGIITLIGHPQQP